MSDCNETFEYRTIRLKALSDIREQPPIAYTRLRQDRVSYISNGRLKICLYLFARRMDPAEWATYLKLAYKGVRFSEYLMEHSNQRGEGLIFF